MAWRTAAPITNATRARMGTGHFRWPSMRTNSAINDELTMKLAMAADRARMKQ